MKRSHDPKHFLTAEETEQVSRAITEAESRTSAEFKLLIVRHCFDDIRRKASRLFRKHGLDKTVQRNAVMIMIVTTNRELLIYGDQGIHQYVQDDYWTSIRDQIVEGFKAGLHGHTLQQAIIAIGNTLAEHFPIQPGDVNEIPNEVAYDE